jgi:DNA topoisomerase-1
MAQDLVIVESPAKAKTISKYLGNGYVVKASNGHVRDLPTNKLGIKFGAEIEPEYEIIKGKKKILDQLKKIAEQSARVLIASDFDREGEAIGWHIQQAVRAKNNNVKRIVFNEITERAIRKSVEEAGPIDMNKVNAQQARRVLDRLVGYKISPILWRKVKAGLSAGRVQSVAVRLICEREKEIGDFVPTEYWSIDATFRTPRGDTFPASLETVDGEKKQIGSETDAADVLKELDRLPYTVSSVVRKETQRRPYGPFRTSTLQQDAARKLRFSPYKTMLIAQQLYEGIELGDEGSVALISYMRTDSTRVSEEAQGEAKRFIIERHGARFYPKNPNVFKNKQGAQDAHEAIRPTSCYRTPEDVAKFLSGDQLALYKLIWERFLASQMAPALLDKTSVGISAGRFVFRATGSIVIFPGFLVLYKEPKEENGNGEVSDEERVLPEMHEGERVEPVEIAPHQHFTMPPARYSEATLVKALEEQGIGRPSTYATIVNTVQTRKYVSKRKGKLYPTELGQMVNGLLVESFPVILDVGFTAQMETELDQIEDGNLDWQALLRKFYSDFENTLAVAEQNMVNLKREGVPTSEICEKCGKPMVIKPGRFGVFLACSGYPNCKNTRSVEPRNNAGKEPPQPTDKKCQKCGGRMVLRTAATGRFYGCENYPKCRFTLSVETGVKCPEPGCDGDLIERKTRQGRRFYSCSRYPTCKFAVWDKPIPMPCPKCGAPFVVIKVREGEQMLRCRTKGCSFEQRPEIA